MLFPTFQLQNNPTCGLKTLNPTTNPHIHGRENWNWYPLSHPYDDVNFSSHINYQLTPYAHMVFITTKNMVLSPTFYYLWISKPYLNLKATLTIISPSFDCMLTKQIECSPRVFTKLVDDKHNDIILLGYNL